MQFPGEAVPINTVIAPFTITPPDAVLSVNLAASKPLIITLGQPVTMASGELTTSFRRSVTRAAGSPSIKTFGEQGGRITPPPQGHECSSETRAAGVEGIEKSLPHFGTVIYTVLVPSRMFFQIRNEQVNVVRRKRNADAFARTFDGSQFDAKVDPASGDVLAGSPTSAATRYSFNDEGFISRITSPLGRQWNLTSDSSGRATSIKNPTGSVASFGYDPRGRLAQVDRDGQPLFQLQHDATGNVIRTAHADGTDEFLHIATKSCSLAYLADRGLRRLSIGTTSNASQPLLTAKGTKLVMNMAV